MNYELRIKNYIGRKGIIITPIILVFVFFIIFNTSAADPKADTYGLDTTAAEAGDSGLTSNVNIPATIGKIVGAGLAFVGILFFILMIYGGILWMTAQGNDQQVTKAKDLIIAAIIGLIIVLSAYAITAYIGGAITS